MSEGRSRAVRGERPVLLQVCANDHPPFAEICHQHAVAAASLGWESVVVMLAAHGSAREPSFLYADGDFAATAADALQGRAPVLTLCHRYRAYRALVTSGVVRSGIIVVAHEFGLLGRRRRRWQRRWDRLRGRAPVTFAGVSDAVTEELAAAAGDAVLLPNGIDLARVDASRLTRPAALHALGLSPDTFNVGVVGRLHPKKNPLLAVAAFAWLAGRAPDAVLVFVGDGELTDDVRAAAADLPVRLAGFVPDAAAHMAAFDLLLMPSGEREAFGMVALEAMAAGVPVLCGAAPGPRFVVGDAGRVFQAYQAAEVGKALLAAWEDWRRGTLAALGRRGRARVETEFSVAAGAGRLEALAVTQ